MSFASELSTWSGGGYSAVPLAPNYTSPAFKGSDQSSTYWSSVLNKIGAPVTQSNIDFLNSWASLENTTAAWNPLATTQGTGSTFNSAGVKNFSSLEEGASATAATISNGYYPSILAALGTGDASGAAAIGGVVGAGMPTYSLASIAPASSGGSGLTGTSATGQPTTAQSPLSAIFGAVGNLFQSAGLLLLGAILVAIGAWYTAKPKGGG